MPKKMIEVALPLEAINAASAREKSIRHGHPSTLHLWWARRPLAAARAVIWASLVDDPSEHLELFPTEESQFKERERLFQILSDLVVWENSNNEMVLDQAKAEIMKYTNGNPPALLDPFAGGGAIPLEAQRLGLEAHAHDLNPVAVMINKAMIEIPPRFADMSPVNPEDNRVPQAGWKGAAGLARDVEYYGKWMKEEAFKRIGHLYPKVKLPEEQGGGEATVIAWIWARTVKCPNPACGCELPLMSSFVLSKKNGHEAWVSPHFCNGEIAFCVHNGKYDKSIESGTKMGKKASFCCPVCKNGLVDGDYINSEANNGRMGAIPVAIVAEGINSKIYLPFTREMADYQLSEVDKYYNKYNIEDKFPRGECRGTFASNAQGRRYGFFHFKDYFTKRQQIALITFSDLIIEAQNKIVADAIFSGLSNDSISLSNGGKGAMAYGEAIAVYLAFALDRLANRSSTVCPWNKIREEIEQTFGRPAISMTWDYVEGNVFSDSTGSWSKSLEWIPEYLIKCMPYKEGFAYQYDAQCNYNMNNVIISTDPPYYDNISYADLSDYFYIWLRKSLKNVYPEIFRTVLVPKTEELIASSYRFDGNMDAAKEFFENGMFLACKQFYDSTSDEIPVTIYFAYKQNNTDRSTKTTSSSGWETMLSAIIRSGFIITGTWPIHTERATGLKAFVNALASSVVLVCKKRDKDARICTRRDFVTALKRELKPALEKLQQSNIAPVDLAQSAIGPGMAVFSRYQKVLEADGAPMSVRSALQIINQELDLYFNGQDSSIDNDSRFCVELFSQCAYNPIKFGDADILARAKGTSVAQVAGKGVIYAAKGEVHLLERDDLPEKVNQTEHNIWLLTQQLTRAMEKGGIQKCAEIVAPMLGIQVEEAKNLAYRLYSICERKNWAQEAYAYNALVVAWPEIQSKAAEILATPVVQITLSDIGLKTEY